MEILLLIKNYKIKHIVFWRTFKASMLLWGGNSLLIFFSDKYSIIIGTYTTSCQGWNFHQMFILPFYIDGKNVTLFDIFTVLINDQLEHKPTS